MSIIEDDNGFLWLATEKGLSCFDRATSQVRNYDKYDGFPPVVMEENTAQMCIRDRYNTFLHRYLVIELINSLLVVSRKYGRSPVSYTHLDVYKRQHMSITLNKKLAKFFITIIFYWLINKHFQIYGFYCRK